MHPSQYGTANNAIQSCFLSGTTLSTHIWDFSEQISEIVQCLFNNINILHTVHTISSYANVFYVTVG